jgi:ferric-dicitrate binding protein FerR (iron transport regulator)
MTTVRNEPESNDASIEELLRAVGARDEPSPDAARDVMSAVRTEWLAIVQQRRQQQRVMAWRIAASLTLAVLIATFAYRFINQPVQIASIVNVHGHLLAAADDGAPLSRAVGEFIEVGDTVQTDAQSRAAFSFPGGLSLRLDHDTRLTVAAADRINLTSGAIYIDAPTDSNRAEALTVETIAGSVQHVGTQYEVRAHADGMQVSVREGRVIVTSPTSSSTGEAGQVLRLSTDGELTRGTLAATDPYWQWALQAAATFDIDNQSLATFLQWIARETGRHLVYSSPQAEATAAKVKLSGSIAGLDADAALAAVLSTTQLRRYRTDPTELGIELAPIDSNAPARQTR